MDFADMTPEQIAELIEQGKNELIRRQNNTLLDSRLAEVQDEFRDAGILHAPPEVWDRPTEARDTYGRGDVVDWDGGRREATAGFVVCSPACDDHWIDYVEPEEPEEEPAEVPEPVETVEWTGAGTLTSGTHVTYQGRTYLVKTSHGSRKEWSPAKMPALFEEVDDA